MSFTKKKVSFTKKMVLFLSFLALRIVNIKSRPIFALTKTNKV